MEGSPGSSLRGWQLSGIFPDSVGFALWGSVLALRALRFEETRFEGARDLRDSSLMLALRALSSGLSRTSLHGSHRISFSTTLSVVCYSRTLATNGAKYSKCLEFPKTLKFC